MSGEAAEGGAGSNCNDVELTWPSAPVDFVITVDNSGSMVAETEAAELALNGPFASALAASGLDYRVILFTRHRRAERASTGESATSICVAAPLSGAASCPAEAPVFSERFFQYSIKVESLDTFDLLLAAYDAPDSRYGLAPLGWSAWLRPNSRTVLTVVSDDSEDMPPTIFADALASRSPEHFGMPGHPTFSFHSIVGMAPKTDPDPASAYVASEPLQPTLCTNQVVNSVATAGLGYQELSVRTSGLRFPVCQTERLGEMFAAIVQDSVAKSGPGCESELPLPRPDLARLGVSYAPTSGASTPFTRVAARSECASDSFYIDGTRVRLCPEACDQVRARPGTLQLHTCAP